MLHLLPYIAAMMEAVFWISLGSIAYAYFGYPVLVALWPFKRAVKKAKFEPSISFVVAGRNEELRIDDKIRHLLSLPYPAALREVLVISDGSTDGTAERLAAWVSSPDVRTFQLAEHRGKASALNLAVSHARGEIIIFNDVRQELAADAVPLLMENFADPEVGCASGELRFASEGQEQLKSTLYWKYERWLRHQESLAGSVMGGTGAFCAIRRKLFRPLPEGLILDDVYTPLQIALQGWRVIHDERARFFDVEAASEKQEFLRKVRTLSGNYQLLKYLPSLLLPGRIGFQYFSHKLIRLLVPVLLVALLVASWMSDGWFYRLAFAGQAVFYLIGVASLAMKLRLSAILGIPGAFLALNSAAAVALFYFLTGREVQWKKQ